MDTVDVLCCSGNAWTGAEGPAGDHKAGGAVLLREVVQRGKDIRRAELGLRCLAVVETDAGDAYEEC